MKVFFTVQGEGRGHLTQAIGLNQFLQRHGHSVVRVLVGCNGERQIPDYFQEAFDVPVDRLDSPGFQFNAAGGVSTLRSALRLFNDMSRYRSNLHRMREEIQHAQPDLIVNFLEPLMGWLKRKRAVDVPTLAVGHHFMLGHPAFVRIREFPVQQLAMRAYVKSVGARSAHLALSFYPTEDVVQRQVYVCPPMLRQHLFELGNPTTGNYLLVYLLNHAYAEKIQQWSNRHPEVPIHCFYDRPHAPETEWVRPNLAFHRLSGTQFLTKMAGCRALVCTAGFESVCEAAYLGKPILMVPVEHHVEQYLNACDAEQAGIGLKDTEFRISRLLAPNVPKASSGFRDWVQQAESIAVRVAEKVAGVRRS